MSPITLCQLLFTAAAASASTSLAAADTIHVDGSRLARPLQDMPTAASRLAGDDLAEAGPRIQLDEWLHQVPGLFLQNRYNFAQGQRLASRGFGARSAFGVRGIRIRVDGFPETLPDGQSQVDAIDLDALHSIEVLRGASSVPYGNAGGGVINLHSHDGRQLDHRHAARVVAGGDSLRKIGLRTGGDGQRLFHHFSLSQLDYDGWRPQSAVRKTLLGAQAGYRLDEDRELRLSISALHLPRGEDPGGLSRAQLASGRRQATPMAEALDAGQDVDQQRIGLSYTARGQGPAGSRSELTLRAFDLRRDFAQQLPFPGSSRIALDRRFQGVSADYALAGQLGGHGWRASAGLDVERQQDQRQRHRVTGAAVVTDLLQQERQVAQASGAFSQAEFELTPTLSVNAGLRFDRLRLSIDDYHLVDGDDGGSRRFTIWSSAGGLLWRLHEDHRLYAGIGTAFESPTFTEFANPDGSGGFNPDIEPQRTRSHELGLRGRFGARLDYDLALYSVRVRDELLPYEIAGRSFYENAARTRRDGAELSLQWRPLEALHLQLGYAWGRYRFARFSEAGLGELRGRHLPGLPEHSLHGALTWRPAPGRYLSLDSRLVGRLYADNANQMPVAAHAVFGLRAGTAWHFAGGRQLHLMAGIDNLLDRDHYANLRINANPNLALEQRGYFEPAPPRRLWLGIEMRLGGSSV